MKLLQLLLGRLPSKKSILGIYAVIVTVIYSWTLFTSFYKLPSWLFYLTVGKILSVYAYAFSLNLLESVLALAGILLLDLTLFFVWKNVGEFQSRSILLFLCIAASSVFRLASFGDYGAINFFLTAEGAWWLTTFLLGLIVSALAPKIHWVRLVLDGLAERLIIFLYIYIPLSFISLIIVFFRNIQ
jgi:hypothetical protein